METCFVRALFWHLVVFAALFPNLGFGQDDSETIDPTIDKIAVIWESVIVDCLADDICRENAIGHIFLEEVEFPEYEEGTEATDAVIARKLGLFGSDQVPEDGP